VAGSLDLRDLTDFLPDSLSGKLRNLYGPPRPFKNFESVAGKEWILLLLLGAFAWGHKNNWQSNLKWLVLGGVFLILALGPFLKWDGEFNPDIRLPYAWLYKWLPGFSRLSYPGRAFLVTIISISVLACRGLENLVSAFAARSRTISRAVIHYGAAVIIFLVFSIMGNTTVSLPKTEINVPLVYQNLGEEKDDFAILELPFSGNIFFRNYCQTIHGKPIFRGEVPTFVLENKTIIPILKNRFISALNKPVEKSAEESDLKDDILHLSRLGFRYLLLHANDYRSRHNFLKSRRLAEVNLGAAGFEGGGISAWRLPDAVQDAR